jgi:hypothetical protein
MYFSSHLESWAIAQVLHILTTVSEEQIYCLKFSVSQLFRDAIMITIQTVRAAGS